MACEAEWDAYQLAISARIAAEIVEELAIEARQAAQMTEWNACMAWWYCGQQGMRSSHNGLPSLQEAEAGLEAANDARLATQSRIKQLHREFERVTGTQYDTKANGGSN